MWGREDVLVVCAGLEAVALHHVADSGVVVSADNVDSVRVFAALQSCHHVADQHCSVNARSIRLLDVSGHRHGHSSIAGRCVSSKFGRDPISCGANADCC